MCRVDQVSGPAGRLERSQVAERRVDLDAALESGRPMASRRASRCCRSIGDVKRGVRAGAVVKEHSPDLFVYEPALLVGPPHQLFGADPVEAEELVGHVGVDPEGMTLRD